MRDANPVSQTISFWTLGGWVPTPSIGVGFRGGRRRRFVTGLRSNQCSANDHRMDLKDPSCSRGTGEHPYSRRIAAINTGAGTGSCQPPLFVSSTTGPSVKLVRRARRRQAVDFPSVLGHVALVRARDHLRPRLHAPVRVENHAQDAVDAEPGMPEAGACHRLSTPLTRLTLPGS